MPKHSPRRRASSVFNQLKTEYHALNQRRKFFYETMSIDSLFQTSDLNYREVISVSDCLSQLYATDPKLIFDFVVKNSSFALLPSSETSKIASNFVFHLHALETSYLTWRFGTEHRQSIMVLPNKMFFDMQCINTYFCSPGTKEIVLEKEKACITSSFVHQFDHVMDFVNTYITSLNPAYDEIVFIIGLIMFDPTVPDISANTRNTLMEVQRLLIQDFLSMYHASNVDPQVRLNTMLKVASGVKTTARKNMTYHTVRYNLPKKYLKL